MQKERLSRLGRNGKEKDVVKLSCFPGKFLSGVSRFFVSDGRSSVRSKIGRCRITTFRQNTDFNVGLTPDLYANLRNSPYRSGVNPTSNKGFTLIELLVVVLIIGILAAVALPQYQKVVERARAAQVLPLLKAVAQAYASYHLANGTYATSFEELPVDIEWTGRDTGYHFYSDVRSNEDWSLQLSLVGPANTGLTGESVLITRLRGPYRGGGFSLNTKTQELFCAERPIFTNTPGSYCEKIFKGTNTGISADTKTYYLP